MMKKMIAIYDQAVAIVSSKFATGIMLIFVRVALGGIFWRSARTKIEEGSLLTVSDTTTLLFENEFGMPYPEITGHIAAYAEHFLPILIVLGLFTRIGATGLLIMTMVIQLFVFPEAWWPVHILWVALSLTLVTMGPGMFSIDNYTRKASDRSVS
jgi:putative oxidoreductase